MSLGPEKIILILVVALVVFGPQRLPEIARQVGSAIRELRRMQDTVRGELEQVLHPDFLAPDPAHDTPAQDNGVQDNGVHNDVASIEETDHAALAPGALSSGTYPNPVRNPGVTYASDMTYPTDARNGNGNSTSGDYADEDVTDDGFAGPRSFS
jgi:sec-independent protein translocase protein TatB